MSVWTNQVNSPKTPIKGLYPIVYNNASIFSFFYYFLLLQKFTIILYYRQICYNPLATLGEGKFMLWRQQFHHVSKTLFIYETFTYFFHCHSHWGCSHISQKIHILLILMMIHILISLPKDMFNSHLSS